MADDDYDTTPREIAADGWASFLEGFTTRYAGWLTTLEIGAPGVPTRIASRNLPLGGIMLGVTGGGTSQLCLALEAAAGGTEEIHLLPEPTRIELVRSDVDEAELKMELKRGSKIRFVVHKTPAVVVP